MCLTEQNHEPLDVSNGLFLNTLTGVSGVKGIDLILFCVHDCTPHLHTRLFVPALSTGSFHATTG